MSNTKELTYYEYWLTKKSWPLESAISLIADYIKFKRGWEPSDVYGNYLSGLTAKIVNQVNGDKPKHIFTVIAYSPKGMGLNVDQLSEEHFNLDRSEVIPIEFIRWIHDKVYSIPFEFKAIIGLEEPVERLTDRQASNIDKAACRAVAKTLWDIYPDMTIEQMIDHKAILVYGGGRAYERDTTLRRWLSDVDPRTVKTGPKKKP